MEDGRRKRYGTILEESLREWSRWNTSSDPITTRVVIDRDTDTYLLTRTGWQTDRHVLSTIFHATLKEGKVYMEWDGTQPSLTVELLERGIPRTDMVFAWQHPDVWARDRRTEEAPAPSDGAAGVWRMDVRRRYQTIIKDVLLEYEGYEAGGQAYPLHSHFVFDDEHADYLMVTVGLQPRSHWPVHAIIFHAWVEYDIVWVACDNVSPSVSEEFIERGIPHRDVRPAWQFPFDRARATTDNTSPAILFSPFSAAYRAIVQEALQRYTHQEDTRTGTRPITVFDTHADRYSVIRMGRADEPHMPECLVLVTLQADRVRIKVNATGDDLARILTAHGIPADAITVG